MSVLASREHPTSDVPISFQRELETGALWVTFVAMCVSLKFDQVLVFFNVCIGLCPSNVASVRGTVPALAAEAHGARTSVRWAVHKITGEGDCCSASLTLSPMLQGRRVSCSTLTNSRTELAAFDSALLRRTGLVDEIPCVFTVAVPVFLGQLSAAPPSRQNCWVSTKVLSVSGTVLTKWKLEFKLPIPVIGIHIL